MTISQELVDRYSSEVDIDWRQAFVLKHPKADTAYLIDYIEQHEGIFDESTFVFQPVPAQVVMPTRDSSGRQDMSIVWSGIGEAALNFLREAIEDGITPIQCFYSIFIIGNPEPQMNPWMEFLLTNISVSEDSVTAIASRSDILNRLFPNEVYRTDLFPGLRRR